MSENQQENAAIKLDPFALVSLLRRSRTPVPPPEAGVYLLFDGEEVVYVGRSIHVRERVEAHHATKVFDAYAMVPVPEMDQTWVEKALIQAIKPRYNKDLLEPGKPFRHVTL